MGGSIIIIIYLLRVGSTMQCVLPWVRWVVSKKSIAYPALSSYSTPSRMIFVSKGALGQVSNVNHPLNGATKMIVDLGGGGGQREPKI